MKTTLHRIGYCLALLLLPLLLTACQKPQEHSLFAMDTFMQLTVYGKRAAAALDDCESEIRRLEALLSATLPNSDVSRINRAEGTPVDVDATTAALLTEACHISQTVGGAFDISVRPLVTLWGFHADTQRVPMQAEIDACLPLPNLASVQIDGSTVTLPASMQIDLGGIAKGYCGEQLRNLLTDRGIDQALLSLGGNVEAIGTKPDGSPWRIAIRDPKDSAGVLGVVEVVDCAVVTAGSYQRYFEQDGKQYHHILDPKIGYPADSGLSSVTVITKSGTRADALSTAFFVLGTEASLALLETDAFSDCEAIFVEEDGTIIFSGNVRFVE